MKALLTAAVAFSFMVFCNCRRDLPPEPPFVVFVGDAGAFDEPFDDVSSGGYANPRCALACAKLQSVHCSDGFKRPGEDSCYVLCKRAEGTGKIDFNLECVLTKITVAGVRECGTYRCL
jgi:hypothetical protein